MTQTRSHIRVQPKNHKRSSGYDSNKSHRSNDRRSPGHDSTGNYILSFKARLKQGITKGFKSRLTHGRNHRRFQNETHRRMTQTRNHRKFQTETHRRNHRRSPGQDSTRNHIRLQPKNHKRSPGHDSNKESHKASTQE
jgi:hypothetical protein